MSLGALAKAFAQRPPISPSRIHRLLGLPFTGFHNSFWGALERLAYSRLVKRTEVEPPIFVLGHWRSGTTLLHNLISMDDRFSFPNLYQTMFPDHFLLTEKVATTLTAPFIPKTRPMDNVEAGWKHPQEDELAIFNRTTFSPYLQVLFMGYDIEKYDKYFRMQTMTPHEQQRWEDEFTWFMKKVTVREKKRIVVKSPGHTYRVPTLLKLFPEAKFVYIHRNPYSVINSTLHLRSTMLDENGLAKLNLEGIEDHSISTFVNLIEAYETDKQAIPAGNLHEMAFSDLEQDPIGQIRQTYETLGLGGFDAVLPKLKEVEPKLKSYRKNKFELDREKKERWYSRTKAVFERYGYDPELNESESASDPSIDSHKVA